ncbi:ribonuclease P [Sarracenia purpurea var. burkii]
MVRFKNRYMVMEVFLDPNRDLLAIDPIIITQFNILKAIKDSLLESFGEYGLSSSLGSFQYKYFLSALGSIKACKNATLKCDELNFEQYKLLMGANLTAEVNQHVGTLSAFIGGNLHLRLY